MSRRNILVGGGLAALGVGGIAVALRKKVKTAIAQRTQLASFAATPDLVPHDPARMAHERVGREQRQGGPLVHQQEGRRPDGRPGQHRAHAPPDERRGEDAVADPERPVHGETDPARRDVVGVGQFWTVRPLATYASTNVDLLQVRDTFQVYPWLVDLGAYRDADPTFVVVGSGDVWPTSVEDLLGRPASVTHCTGFDVWDYAGTSGAARLRSDVVGSADVVRRERGF